MKKLKEKDFIDILLLLERDIKEDITNLFLGKIGGVFRLEKYRGNKRQLSLEATILSLWIITVALPSDELRYSLHEAFCDLLKLTPEEKHLFLQAVDKRYKIYFKAFNMWQDNHSRLVLGGAILEIIQNGNLDTTLSSIIVDANASFVVNVTILHLLEVTLEKIADLKKKYDIEFLVHK